MRDGIASESAIVAEDEQRFSDFTIAENEQRFSLLQTLFFVRLFDGLEHASLICVYMDLQRRIASYNQSES